MPGPSPTQRLNKLDEFVARLTWRADSADTKLQVIESRLREGEVDLKQIDRRLAVVEEILTRQEKKLDDLLARRWDLAKIVLTILASAIVGALLKGASGR